MTTSEPYKFCQSLDAFLLFKNNVANDLLDLLGTKYPITKGGTKLPGVNLESIDKSNIYSWPYNQGQRLFVGAGVTPIGYPFVTIIVTPATEGEIFVIKSTPERKAFLDYVLKQSVLEPRQPFADLLS